MRAQWQLTVTTRLDRHIFSTIDLRRSFRPPLCVGVPEGNQILHAQEPICNALRPLPYPCECTTDFDDRELPPLACRTSPKCDQWGRNQAQHGHPNGGHCRIRTAMTPVFRWVAWRAIVPYILFSNQASDLDWGTKPPNVDSSTRCKCSEIIWMTRRHSWIDYETRSFRTLVGPSRSCRTRSAYALSASWLCAMGFLNAESLAAPAVTESTLSFKECTICLSNGSLRKRRAALPTAIYRERP